MGYETNFTLEQKRVEIDEDLLLAKLRKVSDYHWEDGFQLSGKWYDYDDNMLEISMMFPETLFVLSGDGEEQGDVWRSYYIAGKTCRVKPVLTWPEFDEAELE